jgi:hypothetical protein
VKIQISCINKREHLNPHERILYVGGINSDGTRWKLSETQAIVAIEAGQYSFYVNVLGRMVDVIVAIHLGRKYLKTVADGYAPNNLLSLDECPLR